jgi:hypothetical protein
MSDNVVHPDYFGATSNHSENCPLNPDLHVPSRPFADSFADSFTPFAVTMPTAKLPTQHTSSSPAPLDNSKNNSDYRNYQQNVQQAANMKTYEADCPANNENNSYQIK